MFFITYLYVRYFSEKRLKGTINQYIYGVRKMKSRSTDIMKSRTRNNTGIGHVEFLTKQKPVMVPSNEVVHQELITSAIKDVTYTVQDVVASLRASDSIGFNGSIDFKGVMAYQCKKCKCKINVAIFISLPEVCPKCGGDSTLIEIPNRHEDTIFHHPDFGVSLETFEIAYQQILLERALVNKQRHTEEEAPF